MPIFPDPTKLRILPADEPKEHKIGWPTFQAVIVRFAPDVQRGELLNVGVLLCSGDFWSGSRFLTDWSRIESAFPGTDLDDLLRATTWMRDRSSQILFWVNRGEERIWSERNYGCLNLSRVIGV